MCGIAGIFSFGDQVRDLADHLGALSRSMVRRGPDSDGLWMDVDKTVGFAFRRLAILDLSAEGDQPMVDPASGCVLVFNGELYNFRDLRSELEGKGHRFRSQSDSEVVLKALIEWGPAALSRFNGMFALGFFHAQKRELWLARDRFGVKPLHYHKTTQGVCFASQCLSLQASPWGAPQDWNLSALKLFLHLAYLPAPYGFHEETFQVEPGQFLCFDRTGQGHSESFRTLPQPGENQPSFAETERVFDQAISRQMVSDVPLGLFLSGGMDSSIIAVAAKKQNPALQAFTMAVPGWAQDEGQDADAMGQALQLNHKLINFGENELLSFVDPALQAHTEPFGDYSLLPTFLVSNLARQSVTVALSGDGGDELFMGYERPFSLLRNAADFHYPRWVRQLKYGMGKWGFGPAKSQAICHASPGSYYRSVHARIHEHPLDMLFETPIPFPGEFALYEEPSVTWDALFDFSRRVELTGQLQRCLKKVDMASMYHSLEVRVPLLDDAVVDFAFSIKRSLLFGRAERKIFLRNYLEKVLPQIPFSKQKKGFSVPLSNWLKGPLRTFMHDQLTGLPNDIPVFSRSALEGMMNRHHAGQHQAWGLWSLISLAHWAGRIKRGDLTF